LIIYFDAEVNETNSDIKINTAVAGGILLERQANRSLKRPQNLYA
jgi:hypothetical protein